MCSIRRSRSVVAVVARSHYIHPIGPFVIPDATRPRLNLSLQKSHSEFPRGKARLTKLAGDIEREQSIIDSTWLNETRLRDLASELI